MRFNCGPSISDRLFDRRVRFRAWHRYFAWFPIRVYRIADAASTVDDRTSCLADPVCVWLEYIERRKDPYNKPTYRLPEENK